MRAVVQVCRRAEVRVAGERVAQIGRGLVVLIGVAREDDAADADQLADRIAHLRVFPDEAGKMNRSLLDVGGEALLVSQFTLLGDARGGRRPSFTAAAAAPRARALFEAAASALGDRGVPVQKGRFGEHMEVELVNEGPLTILLDTRKAF
ncbi:MAG: D-tyrosyl-tRNA(Tyr) deacylase [Clostridia bacterium]|nr:D-tyrosyl-tRNA(Tyr) deacylase [Clostridia bacterium]